MNTDFNCTRIATARFYAEHILPSAALSSKVVKGAGSVLALTEAQF